MHYSCLVVGDNPEEMLDLYKINDHTGLGKHNGYELGGRFKDFLKLKDGTRCNTAKIKDIENWPDDYVQIGALLTEDTGDFMFLDKPIECMYGKFPSKPYEDINKSLMEIEDPNSTVSMYDLYK